MKKEAILLLGILIIVSGIILVLAAEIIDNDNDGYNSTIDCDDNDSAVWRNVILYIDNDGDLIGGLAAELCIGANFPSGYTDVLGDCNDTNSELYREVILYPDNDNDGFGTGSGNLMCIGLNFPLNYTDVSGECDDTNPDIHPEVEDIINNGIDENCDGFDNIDLDGDGFFRFNLNDSEKDCDDSNQFVYPNSLDKCNNIDDNCNGIADEAFPDKGDDCYSGIGECETAGERICNQNGNGTKCRAVAKNPSQEICDDKDNDCDGETDEEDICNMNKTGIVINLPDREIYNAGKVPLNISVFGTGKLLDKISYVDYSEKKPREITLCRKCIDYGKSISKILRLKEGKHELLFRAYFKGGLLNASKEIFVDSKKPKIYLPRIRSKSFTNGTFQLDYDEENAKKITLYYENKSAVNENCTSGKKQSCLIQDDLSKYNGRDIFYSFEIEDIAGNIEKSKNLTAEVDLDFPIIENINYPVIGNYVYFRLNITEKNFKDVSYYDNSDENAKWKILCSVLKGGICEKSQRLTPGEHNITIRVSDKAGNAVSAQV